MQPEESAGFRIVKRSLIAPIEGFNDKGIKEESQSILVKDLLHLINALCSGIDYRSDT